MTSRAEPSDISEAIEAFRDAAERHKRLLLDLYDYGDEHVGLGQSLRERLGNHHFGDDTVESVAFGFVAEQEIERASRTLESLVSNARGRLGQTSASIALMYALFLIGRRFADDVQIDVGAVRFGDHLQDLRNLLIQPDAMLGDFSVDFLLTYRELGPNPAHHRDPSQPVGIEEQRRTALVCDDRNVGGGYHDQRLRRQALADSLGVRVVSYTEDEAGRDPFALAHRAIRDLSIEVGDSLGSA